jgi:hypothetical protein
MSIRQGENGKAGEGQMAGPTHAAANFDPIVSLVMSLLAPPAVRSNRIAQTPRTTARDRFLAGSSPVQIWLARITAKWDKNNRTAWEALSLNRLLLGSVFRRGLPLPHKIRMKAIIPPALVFVADRIKIGRLNAERVGYLLCSVFHSFGESACEVGRNDALPGPRVDGTASTKCNHGGVGISERLPIPVA